jgi:hypothetical protein
VAEEDSESPQPPRGRAVRALGLWGLQGPEVSKFIHPSQVQWLMPVIPAIGLGFEVIRGKSK